MIQAKHSAWFDKFFMLYLRHKTRSHFSAIESEGTWKDNGKPILVIANHTGWWDGFWVYMLNKKVFRKKFHVMMLQEQLQKNIFLQKLGAFSIQRNSRSALKSLTYAGDLLSRNENLVLIFPQGEIQSQHQQSIHFKQGWSRIINNTQKPLQVIFIVHFTDYLSLDKPTLFQYYYCPENLQHNSCDELERAYNQFYETCKQKQSKLCT